MNSTNTYDEEMIQWQCNDTPELDMANAHLPSLENILNVDKKQTLSVDNSPTSSNIANGCDTRFKAEVLDIIYMKQEVGKSDEVIEQPNVFCMQEPIPVVTQVTNDITTSINQLSHGYLLKSEEVVEGVLINEEATNGIVCKKEDDDGDEKGYDKNCKQENVDENSDFILKDTNKVMLEQEFIPPYPSSPETRNPPYTFHRYKTIEVLTKTNPDKRREREFMDGGEFSLQLLSSLVRPCFENMFDNNILHNSQQYVGEMKRTNDCVKKKLKKIQKSMPARDCGTRSDKAHKCDICSFSATYAGSLVIHKRKHTGERPYQCDKCPYAAAKHRDLVQHKRKHTGEKPYMCDKCAYATAHARALVRHIKCVHSGEKPFLCEVCGFATASDNGLVNHKRIHTGEKPYKCDKCPYAARLHGNIIAHKFLHTGKKPFPCDKCPYAAACASTLVAHKRNIHTGERPFQCNMCSFAGAWAASLARHKRTHTGELPYKCDKCPFAAAGGGSLLRHKLIHTGEKPYQCDKCPYAAKQHSHLARHKRIHTGEKPYQCDKCPYATTQSFHLVQHKRKHTGEKPHQCDKCVYAAATAGAIAQHKKHMHSNKKTDG